MSDTPPIYTDPAYTDSSLMAFPGNVIGCIEVAANTIPDIELVARRPLTPMDPTWSIGIVALHWQPGATERGARDAHLLGKLEPTLSTYTYAIQALVRHADAQDGLALHSLLSKRIRAMLYRDAGLRVALAALTETSFGVTERLQRWGVSTQRFAANEIESEWLYLSTTELQVVTETV